MRGLVRGLIGTVVAALVAVGAVAFFGRAEVDRDAPAGGAWTALPSAGIPGRSEMSVVWTRKAMIVWGGAGDAGPLGDGAAYDLAAGTWTPLPPAPITPRRGHSAVWTGTTMLVFGGHGEREGCQGVCALGDGAAYDPLTNAWTPLAPSPVQGRFGHTAVFLQNRMVVWGGAGDGGGALGDGASYDTANGQWAALPVPPLAPRLGHRAVATTDRMMVWSGSSEATEGGSYFADGAVYSPATNSWSAMAAPPASLDPRDNAAAVWTGEQLLVWGGFGRSATCTPCFYGDGATYDPPSDTWAPMAPPPLSGRGAHRAVWTGRQMLVWGGFDSVVRGDGALYNPFDGTWTRMPLSLLAARQHHAMVWTGSQLIVWGGAGAGGPLADGAVLTPDAF
ncbi:MAG TPA: kelch repeat-containing protein [Acidimicrobiales bacterium]|nr:kelch repeat-containing protein [Acidimicrobiales bacterium]